MTRTFIQTHEFSHKWDDTVYGKKEKENLSKSDRNEIRKAIESLKKSLEGEPK